MFKVLEGATAPTRATKYSAMVDLYARESVVIGAGETKIVPLGVKIDLDLLCENTWAKDLKEFEKKCLLEDFMDIHYLELHPRSSLRAKGLIIGVGVIDLDFPNELGLIVHNPVDDFNLDTGGLKTKYTINKGDKIAQCTLVEHKGYLLGIESDTERSGGFGSTGM